MFNLETEGHAQIPMCMYDELVGERGMGDGMKWFEGESEHGLAVYMLALSLKI